MAGFAEDLNDYYSGINALGLSTAIAKLAEMEPAAWTGNFPTKADAAAALRRYKERLADLRGAVGMSLESTRRQAERTGKIDEWLPPTEAQYRLLTADKPSLVKNAYNTARNGNQFSVESERAQVEIFGSLGIFPENCQAALEAIGVQAPAPGAGPADAIVPPPRDRVIVATGHRTDTPDRKSPRFPNTREAIDKAKAWLREQIEAEKAATKGAISAIAGAASGTDLIFHEVCAELGIRTTVVLPIPREDYCRQSVADGGPDWVERFNHLVNANPPVLLSEDADLPVWAAPIPDYGVFQRGNIFMIEAALTRPNADVTLLALWNGKAGDGPGGTADMVELAKEQGAKTCIEDTDELFGLPK
jgi:hypothetical protein